MKCRFDDFPLKNQLFGSLILSKQKTVDSFDRYTVRHHTIHLIERVDTTDV